MRLRSGEWHETEPWRLPSPLRSPGSLCHNLAQRLPGARQPADASGRTFDPSSSHIFAPLFIIFHHYFIFFKHVSLLLRMCFATSAAGFAQSQAGIVVTFSIMEEGGQETTLLQHEAGRKVGRDLETRSKQHTWCTLRRLQVDIDAYRPVGMFQHPFFEWIIGHLGLSSSFFCLARPGARSLR